MYSVPSTGKGKHFVFNPFHAKRATPWGCLTANDAKRLPVPAIRYLVHDWIACGPETYWPADALRLVPTAEITSNVLINRTPSTSTTLPTTLIIVPSQFYRGGDNCPLLVRGQIFEMVLLAPAEVVVEEIVEDPIIDSDDNIFERFPISALPPPFPGHKWQRLTAAPLKDHDVLASDVAGRYYPLGGELQDEDEVENIAAQAKKSGTTGEVGIKALGLLLAGLVSGGKVPKIEVRFALGTGKRELTHFELPGSSWRAGWTGGAASGGGEAGKGAFLLSLRQGEMLTLDPAERYRRVVSSSGRRGDERGGYCDAG